MSRLPPPADVLEAEPVVADEVALAPGTEPVPRTNWQLFRRRFLRHRLAVVSLVILVILFIACFGASWLAPYPRHPSAVDLLLGTSSGPSAKHWFGTDELGRDQLTQIMYAGQTSLKIGLVVCAGFCGLAVVLHLAGRALVALLTPLASAGSFPLRHAVQHLSRAGNQTRVVLLAVGLGAFFIVGIRSLQGSLLDEFSIQTSADSPDMFLLDVQRGQREGVSAFLSDPAHGTGDFRLIPVLRARVVAVSGRETTLTNAEEAMASSSHSLWSHEPSRKDSPFLLSSAFYGSCPADCCYLYYY